MEVGPVDRLRSAYHGFWFALSERLGRARGPRPETACGELPRLPTATAERVAELRARYGVAFEERLGARSALQAYSYLDLLERLGGVPDPTRTPPVELHDVGCAGFAYASALHAYFRPERLVGFDVEGHRRLRGGVTRRERVLGHLQQVPGGEFVVADYRDSARRAQCVTAFFPFVTPRPVLAWRLPLRVFGPEALFGRIRANLAADHGELYMVNHDSGEARLAQAFAGAAGLVQRSAVECARLDVRDASPVVASRWSA